MLHQLSFKTVIKLFARQRLRSFLAMLGVFLGALMLTLITHILGAINIYMENEAKALGSHVATVTASLPHFSRSADVSDERYENILIVETENTEQEQQDTQKEDGAIAATLTQAQLEAAVEKIPYIVAGSPFVSFATQISAQRKSTLCQLFGTTRQYFDIRELPLAVGRIFSEVEEEQKSLVGVLGHALATRLFTDPEKAVGRYVRLNYSQVRIVGVLQEKGADSSGANIDEFMFIPLSTCLQRFSLQDHVTGWHLLMENRDSIPQFEYSLRAFLREKHRISQDQKDDFTISFAEKVDEMITNAISLISVLGLVGAGISFCVGTLGVFSIMLVMVHARKEEIGIKRAIGASQNVILRQFLWESVVISGTGGFIGVCVAISLVGLIALAGVLPPYFNIPLSVGIFLLSLCCGLLAGGYPAWKASRLSIISVLKNS